MHYFAKIFARLIGWKCLNNLPPDLKKFVALGAPHTSNWDGIVAIMGMMYWKRKFKFLIKSSWFFFPMGYFLRALGAIPVDRSKKNSLTDQVVEYFENSDEFMLAITPEGTRAYNPNWKKGFYYMAEKANVPIVLGYIDFEKKEVCLDKVFERSGDVDKDIELIKEYYKQFKAKNPENGIY